MAAHRFRTSVALLAAGLVGLGCGDGDPTGPESGSDQKTTAELTFLRPAADAPPLLLGDGDGNGIPDTSFVATSGRDTVIEVFYEDPDQPGTEGDRFLRFELDDASLARYPDDHPGAGAAFQPGDTVTITIEVASDTLLANFGPDGLRFSTDDPAELEMRWIRADRDTDGDGNDDLDETEDRVDLWRQEREDEPWSRTGELKDVDGDRIRAFIESFTRWALAV